MRKKNRNVTEKLSEKIKDLHNHVICKRGLAHIHCRQYNSSSENEIVTFSIRLSLEFATAKR